MASGQAPGYDHVDTWHILFGLLREGDGVGAMVLFTLGADQYRVGLRVTQLLNRDRGKEAPGEDSGLDERARARLLDNPLARINMLDQRLAAVERSLGLQPDHGEPGPADSDGTPGDRSHGRHAGIRDRHGAAQP